MSHLFLCTVPIVVVGLVAVRALRVPVLHESLGAALFGAILIAAWVLGVHRMADGADAVRCPAVAGALLVSPFALIALLWVGLGTPWDATPDENTMRYAVLLAGAIGVTTGLVLLTETLRRAGETFHATLGFALNMLAGPAYVVWISFQLGAHAMSAREGAVAPAIAAMGSVNDSLLFVACVLTYLATAGYAASLGRLGWLPRRAAVVYVAMSLVAVALLALRGLAFPDPTAGAEPWSMRPGFIAGIPAVPWIMPFLLGVLLIRRAGDAARTEIGAVAPEAS